MADARAVDRTRSLLRPDTPSTLRADGVLDVRRPENGPTESRAAQRLMRFGPLATIYERAWRPLFRLWMGVSGPTVDVERTFAVRDLGLVDDGTRVVLDVACGPGNFTRFLAESLADAGRRDALVVGLDASEPMLARAARDTARTVRTDSTGSTDLADHVAYVLGDARELPFEDGSVDAVCCYAALYLVPEPMRVFAELVRVLRPGGRLAVMTTVRRGPAVVADAMATAVRPSGLTVFGADDFTDVLHRAGFEAVEQRIHGAAQFVTGRKR
ncbi:class I SAM-dependent methyltransferase [Rhodococcus kroppenstedtii]|uniref:class I SAM-dependent methyltransferase n=1 Tax=Rhodococcoides kroppenstedtii TaxID=293050 RepID=UPI0021C0F534|nr:class I SAM-dependent methyltransferase [Rhodococcus kroppenstedtii]MBY6437375.1 class I SAM-dependent methyltransferase [Rhodococcus kroppenstedtii]